MENPWIKVAISAAVALGIGTSASNAVADAKKESKNDHEKCYGIVKNGMNDCGSPTNAHSCAGWKGSKDNDPNEWIFLPKGACEKITGGVVKK